MSTQINGVAATANGLIGTTKVATQVRAKTQLRFSFIAKKTEGGDLVDVEDLMIKPAVWESGSDVAAVSAAVDFKSQNWKDNMNRFFAYFNSFYTQIVNIRMETTDVENYDGEFVLQKLDPTGKEIESFFALSPFKIDSSKSSGFSNSLVIPGNELSFLLGPNITWKLSRLKAGSKIDFYIDITGETKVAELSDITTTMFQ